MWRHKSQVNSPVKHTPYTAFSYTTPGLNIHTLANFASLWFAIKSFFYIFTQEKVPWGRPPQEYRWFWQLPTPNFNSVGLAVTHLQYSGGWERKTRVQEQPGLHTAKACLKKQVNNMHLHAGDMTWWLRTLTAFPEDPTSIPSTTICKDSPRTECHTPHCSCDFLSSTDKWFWASFHVFVYHY